MRNMSILVIAGFVLLFPKILSGQESDKIVAGEKHVIFSEIIGKEKGYWVHLPMNYQNSKNRYPVLYITDGDEHFYMAAGATEFMSSQYVIPEMIVVAIFHDDRNHDLTPTHSLKNLDGFESDGAKVSGGGEKLLQFIEKELAPKIESAYRTGPYRILAGHSLGGLLAIYAYLNHNQLFNAFISMDPALPWDDHYCEQILRNSSNQSPDLNSKLYISSAHNASYNKRDRSPFRLAQNSFSKILESKQIANTRHDYFENRNHLTVPYESIYAGLAYIFSGFYILDDPQFELDTAYIQAFYKKQSDIYGISFRASERLTEMFGKYFMFDLNDYNRAITFFELNTINYPASYKAFEYLAKANKAAGNTDDAILNYKKALSLDPENKEIKKILIELER